jgi:hypothetical protein
MELVEGLVERGCDGGWEKAARMGVPAGVPTMLGTVLGEATVGDCRGERRASCESRVKYSASIGGSKGVEAMSCRMESSSSVSRGELCMGLESADGAPLARGGLTDRSSWWREAGEEGRDATWWTLGAVKDRDLGSFKDEEREVGALRR